MLIDGQNGEKWGLAMMSLGEFTLDCNTDERGDFGMTHASVDRLKVKARAE